MARIRKTARKTTGGGGGKLRTSEKSRRPRDDRWIVLKEITRQLSTKVSLKLNEQQLLFVASRTQSSGIYTYNLHLHTSTQLFKYSDDIVVDEYYLEIDAQRNKLYGSGFKSPLFIIDLDNDKFIEWAKLKPKKNIISYKGCGSLINVNGQIHLIGGYGNPKHFIWNDEAEQLQQIYDFRNNLDHTKDLSLVYIPTQGKILMFTWFEVWNHDLKTRKWKKIRELEFMHTPKAIVLTSDEHYVILSNSHSRDIYAMDISTPAYKLYKSSVKNPWKEEHLMTKVGGLKDELLVFGWIKHLFKTKELKLVQEPPIYLKVLVGSFYSKEEIHWIGQNSKRHASITINQVLTTLKGDPM